MQHRGADLLLLEGKVPGMDSSEAKRLKQLEGENRKLKHAVAETFDNRASKDVLSKKLVEPAGFREAVSHAECPMSERHACRLLGRARSTKRYQGKEKRDAALCTRLKELTA